MAEYAGLNVHFDELVHAGTIAMRKETFEKLAHPQEAREEAVLEAMDPENPQTEPGEDAETPALPEHPAIENQPPDVPAPAEEKHDG